MKDPNRPERPRSRVKTGSNRGLVFIFVLLVIVTLSFFFYMRFKHSEIVNLFGTDTGSETKITSSDLPHPSKPTRNSGSREKAIEPPSTINGQPATSVTSDSSTQFAIQQKNSNTAQVPEDQKNIEKAVSQNLLPKHVVKEDPYQQMVEELNSFYSHLDQQQYMRDFHLKDPSKTHFSKLLQVLIDNPPSITRETDDYFTLLKNTAHFFRILGKENIVILKGILDREKDSFERIIKTFYTLTDHPEYLKNEYSLIIPNQNLYDYAGFFLNTIGGRLYLFRRDSASRMTISFYAVLIIDKANRQGNSRLGIDLRPAIDSLIEEMENSGNKLKFKEDYLDTLYDLKENYGNRG